MFVVCVQVQVTPEGVGEFIEATGHNARATRREPGNLRFDVLHANEDPEQFFLYEVYREEKDFAAHHQTSHYLAWKARVTPLMAAPRKATKFTSLLPDPWE